MSSRTIIDETKPSFDSEISRELTDDLNELRKQNSSTHERIFAMLNDIENDKKSNVARLESDINELRKQNSSTHERVFDRLNVLEKRNDAQDIRYEHSMEKIDAVTKDMQLIKDKPRKQLDSIVNQIIGLVIAAAVGYILAHLGFN